jgi:hypothetical protein
MGDGSGRRRKRPNPALNMVARCSALEKTAHGHQKFVLLPWPAGRRIQRLLVALGRGQRTDRSADAAAQHE